MFNAAPLNSVQLNGVAGDSGGLTASIFDVVSATSSNTMLWHTSSAATSTAVFEPALASTMYFRSLVSDAASFLTPVNPSIRYTQAVAEALACTSSLVSSDGLAVADAVALQAVAECAYALTLLESVGLSEAQLPVLVYNKSVSEALSLADTLGRFVAADAEDQVSVSTAIANLFRLYAVSETALSMSDVVADTLVLKLSVTDSASFYSDFDLAAVLTGAIVDDISLSLLSVTSGAVTAWAINTASVAVSEYRDFAFNSFVEHGRRVLAASSSGLFVLDGETSDGRDILATIRSGYAQLNGVQLAAVESAYIAIRGEGVIGLKIMTADGGEYSYSAVADNMDTTKVKLGRGLRARYIAFQLDIEGADFDLESVELIPVRLTRRV